MMKTRLIRSLISCALIVCMLTGMLPVNVLSLIAGQATAHAEDFSAADGNWLYRIAEDGYAEILGYSDPNAESLTIPSALEGAWVARIAQGAFADNAALKTIDIPASVAQIAADAFPGHEALTVRAANGTRALAFAAQRGFDVVNTSALDLFDDILDLSEMKSSQFAVVADMVTFSAPYAQQIAVGTKVFLPATGDYTNGLPIEVRSITASGASVVAVFAELPFTDTVETYSVQDVPLTVDYDNIVMLSDGFSMLQTANRGSLSLSVGQKLEFNVDFKPIEDVKVSGKISYEPKYTFSLDYSWFSVNEFSYKNTTTTKIEVGVSCTMDELKEKAPSKAIKFARVPLTSPTLVSVWLDCSFEIGLEGEVVVETSMVTSESFTWKKGSTPVSTKTKTVDDFSLSAAVEISAGVKCTLAVNVGFSGTGFNTDIAQISVSLGMKIKAEVAFSTPDCTDVTESAYFTVGVKIGILSGEHAAIAINLTLFSLTWVIDKLHIEKPFKIVDDCTKDGSHTVTFATCTDYLLETLNIADGGMILELTDPVRAGYTFIGWFTDIKLTDKWDFANDTVTEDITLYAGWQMSDGTIIPPIESEEASLGYLQYEIADGEVEITGYTGNPVTVTIPAKIEGYPVKTLRAGVFEYCDSLTYVSIPDTVEYIGGLAFAECENLQEVKLPPNWTTNSLPDPVFWNSPKLVEMVVPEGATKLSEWAFAGMHNLQRVYLPDSLRTIGEGAFADCSALESISLPSGLKIIEKRAFDECTSLKKISWPSELTSIGASAFENCSAIEEISLPSGLMNIESSAFKNCDGLVSVKIPEGVTRIGNAVFESCENLQKVELPSSWVRHNTEFRQSPFVNCPVLTEIDIPEGVTDIPYHAFYNMTSLKQVSLPSTLETIGEAAFYGCTSLSTIIIPPLVNSIYTIAFSGCTALSHVYVYGEDSYAANYFASNHPAVQVHVIPATFATVRFVSNGGSSVASVYTLAGTTLSAPNAPTRAEYTFTGWYADAACTIPWDFASGLVPEGGMTLYAGWAYTPAGYHYHLGTGTITGYTGGSTHAVLPDSYGDTPLTRLAAEAIPASTRTLHIPAGITQIDPQAFRWAENLTTITVDAANPVYTAQNGVLYTLDGVLVAYPKAKNAGSFAIPDGTTGLGSYAFHGCTALTSLEIPASVTQLAAYAVYDCALLENVAFAADPASIGSGCFLSCADDLMITGPVGAQVLTGYADGVYLNYNQYPVVYMENGVMLGAARSRAGELLGQPPQPETGVLSFKGWAIDENGATLWDFTSDLMPAETLTLYAVWRYDFTMEETEGGILLTGYTGSNATVHVPEYIDDVPVVEIAEDAFPAGTTTLVGNKGSVTEAYAAAHGLAFEALTYSVTFVSNGGTPVDEQVHCATELLAAPDVTRYGYELMGWYRDAALTESWDFASDLMPAQALTLYAGWELTDDSITLIPFTFARADNGLVITGYTGAMGAAEIPAEINGIPVVGIADHAFSGDSSLLQVTIPGSVGSIGASAFAGSRIGSVAMQSGTASIGAYAFSDCSELSSITLADTVTEIGAAAFMNCTALTDITLPGGIARLDEHLFNGCVHLSQIQLPEGLTEIADAAFAGCSRLTAITLGARVEQIAVTAFNGCSRLSEIVVPADNLYFSSLDGVLLSADGVQLLLYPRGKADETYTIPGGVLLLGENAMAGSRIKTLVISDALQAIGSSALRGSLQLEQIEFTQTGGALSTIGSYAFSGCISLTDIVLPDSLTRLGEYAFANCHLNSVTVPVSVSIGAHAFRNAEHMILYGVRGSAAQNYAAIYGLRFIDPATDIPVCGVLLPETLTLIAGQEYQLNASLVPADATETALQWHSTDASVVFVSADGLLSARGTGSAAITVQAMDGSTALCTVTVEDDAALPEQLILSSTELTLEAGTMYPLTAQVLPEEAANADIVWTSSDSAAAIYANGCIFALTPGETVITATLGDELSASCTVTVREPVPPVEITVQPVDVSGTDGAMVEVSLTAQGEGLTYAWYFRDAGSEEFKLTTSFTDCRYYVKMNSARAGRQVYCVVTDAKGNTATSDVVTLNRIEPIRITAQPTDAYAAEGENVVVTVQAAGEGLTYAWYFKDASAKEFKLTTSYKTNTYKLTMTQARSGRQVYCVVTDEHGQTATSATASLYLQNEAKIIRQPESVIAAIGELAEVSLTAAGKGLTYTWYFKDATSKEFKLTTSFTDCRYYVKMNSARAGRQVYCVVTDAYGNSVTTDTVMLATEQPTIITTQPTDAYAAEGDKALVTVLAKGEGLTYAWYFKDAASKDFKLTTSFTGDRYEVAMTEARAGRQVYCVVTDQFGWTETSDVATLYLQNEAKIIRQPESVSAAPGETAEVSLTVVGKGLTYAWYFKDAASKDFRLTTSFTGSRYFVAMTEARAGRQVYCVVTDAYGNSVTSDTVTLSMAQPELITTQPTDAYAAEGENAVVTILAEGEGLTYAWYFKDASGKSFKLTTSFKTNTYKIAMTQARAGRQLYCVVTDQAGRSETSQTVTLYLQNEAKIIRQPESVDAAIGEMAEISVTAAGKGLTYAWYFKDAAAEDFRLTASFTGNRYYVTMTQARAGRQVYCVVTDVYGNAVTTDTVTLSANVSLSSKEAALIGDVNGDGVIDMLDPLELTAWLEGRDVSLIEAHADVNGDGTVSDQDVSALMELCCAPEE